MRFLLLSMAITSVDFFLPLGTPLVLLFLGILFGVILGGRASKLTPLGAVIFSTLGALSSIYLTRWVLSFFSGLDSYIKFLHAQSFLFLLFFTFLLTWAVRRYTWAYLVELFLILSIFVGSLATHRNLQLDMPKVINDISWQLGVSPLITFSAFGVVAALLSIVYGILSVKQLRESRAQISKKFSVVGTALATILFLLIGYLSFFGISRFYQEKGEAFFSNGVGQGSEEGLSPLTFESALGSTNQPAALVRLESDYSLNPTSPMLYLRESALSKFNGKELVLSKIDDDISRDSPSVSFSQVRKEVLKRSELTQEIYLLADHKNPFAIDYPKLITPLKNPNPKRFIGGAYRALSLVPQLKIEMLRGVPVGDPSWSAEARATYLGSHTDPRYHELARKLTADSPTPLDSILKIIDYLAEFTIYTLTPNHKDSEDPVAPYLFGDGRGYCVHISHATVYLLRAIGIPSRIATGYLTDLSQSKDGHILLRMSDRHAWAEVYFEGYGWIPFDTQPRQVESHADTEVDQALLDELMNLVNPAEELVPELPEKRETSESKFSVSWLRPALIILVGVLFAFVLFSKILLLKGYVLFPSLYKISVFAKLMDIGLKREFGETRLNFVKRVKKSQGSDIEQYVRSLNEAKYRTFEGLVKTNPGKKNIWSVFRLTFSKDRLNPPQTNLKLSKFERLKSLVNIRSVFNWWFKRRW